MTEEISAGVTHDIVLEVGGVKFGFMLDRRNPYGLQDSNQAIPNIPNTPLTLADYGIFTIDAQDSWLHGFGQSFHRDEMGYEKSDGVEMRLAGYIQLLTKIAVWKDWGNAGKKVNDIKEWGGGLLGYHLIAFARDNLEGITYYYYDTSDHWVDKPDPDEDAVNESANALLALNDYLLIALDGAAERMVKWNGSTGWTGAGNAANPPKNFSCLERGGGYIWGSEKLTNRLHYAAAADGSDFEGGLTDPNVIKVGTEGPPIIGLCWWRDNLRVARPDMLYLVDRNFQAHVEIPDFAESSSPAMWTGIEPHFEAMCAAPGGLWFSIQNKIYRWTGTSLIDMTPPMWGLTPPYNRWHRFHSFQRFNEYLYCVGQTEAGVGHGDEYLLCYSNGSWHLLYKLSWGEGIDWTEITQIGISRKYGRFLIADRGGEDVPWWNGAYTKRKRITTSWPADTLTTAQISLSLADAADIYNDSQADGDDVRIIWWNGWDYQELNRHLITFTDSSIDIRFKVQKDITATDDNYFIYYKNPSAVNPPKDLDYVYIAEDDFDSEGVGMPPSEWELTQKFNFIRISEEDYLSGAGHGVGLNCWPTYGCSMRRTSAICASGIIKYTFYVRIDDLVQVVALPYYEFRIWDGSGNIGPTIRFWRTSPGGIYQILAANGTTWTVIMTPISTATWYKVEITADLAAKTYDVEIDDVLKADNYGFWAGANVADLRTFYMALTAGGAFTSVGSKKVYFDQFRAERPTNVSTSLGIEQDVTIERGKIKAFKLRDTTFPYDDYTTGTYFYLYSPRYDFQREVITKSFWEFLAKVNGLNNTGKDVKISYRIDDIGDWIDLSTLTTDALHEILFSMPPPSGKWIQFRIGLRTDSATETPYMDTWGLRAIPRPKTAWAHRYNVLIGDGVRRIDGKFDARSPSESLQALMEARDSETPITLQDFWRGKYYGYITSIAVGAVSFKDNLATLPKHGGAVGSAQIVFVPLRTAG